MASVLDCDCTPRCRSSQHASNIISIITRNTPAEIKKYLSRYCHNPAQVCDKEGRTALMVAASVGKWEVVEWLVKEKHAELKARDWESGWTALHRSVFYGQVTCAVHLIQLGANLYKRDFEDLTPLDLVMKDAPPYIEHTIFNANQAYTWGSNTNFTLGHRNQQNRSSPDVVDEFIRNKEAIKQISMSKFHTAFLTNNKTVFTCGHGQGGRLGHGNEQTYMVPRLVQGLTGLPCIQVATARDHTIFLMENGFVFGCGQNTYHQLASSHLFGDKVMTPKAFYSKSLKDKKVIGIAVARFHTVLHTETEVFTCGLNAGQLGHPKDGKYISEPKLVTKLHHKNMMIHLVATSNGATVCSTKVGDIYILQDYMCRKIVTKQLNLVKLVLRGGNLDGSVERDVLKEQGRDSLAMLALHQSGKVFIWQASDKTFRRCVWNRKRQVFMNDLAVSRQGMICCTLEGEAFHGFFANKKSAPLKDTPCISTSPREGGDAFIQIGIKDEAEREDGELLYLERLPHLHRVTRVNCDPQGKNFSSLQADPRHSLTDIPFVSEPKMKHDVEQLMVEANNTDTIHDVIVKVGLQTFPAHRYILASRSDYFRKQFSEHNISNAKKESKADTNGINRPDVQSLDLTHQVSLEMFQRIYSYIYTNTCDAFELDFVDKILSRKGSSGNSIWKGSGNNGQIPGSIIGGSTTPLKGRKKRGGSNKSKGKSQDSDGAAVLDVIKQIRDAAKSFGIKSLFNRLELVKYENGLLYNFRPAMDEVTFDPMTLSHLSDVVLQSEDGELFPCHRCILVARLEYFYSMLAYGWIESSSGEPLKLPIPKSILRIILEFIYKAEAPLLSRSQDMELVCNILVTADQLLMTRLKEMCETVLSEMVNLRSACELLQFAATYQSPQLRATCEQFICLNLASLLENQSMNILSDDVLDGLTKCYKNMVKGICRRIITPYLDEIPFVMKDVIQTLKSKGCPRKKSSTSRTSVSSDNFAKEDIHVEEVQAPNKIEGEPTQARMHELVVDKEKLNISPVTRSRDKEELSQRAGDTQRSGDTLPVEESASRLASRNGQRDSEGVWVKKGASVEVSPQQIPDRVQQEPKGWKKQGSSDAEALVEVSPQQISDRVQQESKGWKKQGSSDAVWGLPRSPKVILGGHVGLRDIMSQELQRSAERKKTPTSPKGGSVGGQGLGKKSQKQKKKELQEKLHGVQDPPAGGSDQVENLGVSTASPWGKPPSVPAPQLSPSSITKPHQHETILGSSPKPGAARKFSFNDAASPRKSSTSSGLQSPNSLSSSNSSNPWHQRSQVKSLPPLSPPVSFTDILKDEAKLEKNLDKSRNKSLHAIQIEERAMEELLFLYQAESHAEEYITIDRVSVTMASPMWSKKGVT